MKRKIAPICLVHRQFEWGRCDGMSFPILNGEEQSGKQSPYAEIEGFSSTVTLAEVQQQYYKLASGI